MKCLTCHKDDRDARGKRSRRPKVVNPVRLGESRNLGDLVSAAKADGRGFAEKVERLASERKLKITDLNLRDTQRALRDVPIAGLKITEQDGTERSITASAFPLLVGNLMVAEIAEGLDEVETIGQELVTEIEDPKKITIIARLHSVDPKVDRVDEAKDFPEISASEESYEVHSQRNGRKFSITQEAIDENDLPNIIMRANKLVQIATSKVERLTLDGVTDRFGSAGSAGPPYAYVLRGASATSLYTTNAATHKRAPAGTSLSNNALATRQNLSNARAILAQMLDDENQRGVVPLSRYILLVPDTLLETAWNLTESPMTAGVVNERSPWGPGGPFRPRLLSTSKLDDVSTTDWFLGDFPAQFLRKVKIAFELATLGAEQQQAFLDRRIAFQARLAWDIGVNAIDHNRVVRCQP